MQHLFSSFTHLITACCSLVQPTSGVHDLAEIVALPSSYVACERIVIFNFKIFKVHKTVDSVVLLFVAVVCGYQLTAESVCSVYAQI
jgi:hypothetical protein